MFLRKDGILARAIASDRPLCLCPPKFPKKAPKQKRGPPEGGLLFLWLTITPFCPFA
jgi:hypothetical protein